MKYVLAIVLLAMVTGPAQAQTHQHSHGHAHGGAQAAEGQHAQPRPYAGFEGREIAALSPEDIAELQRGGGWGLALPAEVNGWPGPAHVLELQADLALDAGQVAAITAIRDAMRDDAIAVGYVLVAAERQLDQAFREGQVDQAGLARMVSGAEAARAELRRIHLAAHLKVRPLLSADQIALYARLRGYAPD